MRRLLYVMVAGVALFGLGMILLLLNRPEPGVTRDNFYRLRLGMDAADVYAILGEDEPTDIPRDGFAHWRILGGPEMRVLLQFDGDGILRAGTLIYNDGYRWDQVKEPASFLDRFRAWLRI